MSKSREYDDTLLNVLLCSFLSFTSRRLLGNSSFYLPGTVKYVYLLCVFALVDQTKHTQMPLEGEQNE